MEQTGLSREEIIRLHTSTSFRVYMLGFLPGFAYMGSLPQELYCRRKSHPRLRVPSQSVGLAGYQTGIYPAEAPGGWQIIGRTPLKIFDAEQKDPFLFRAGRSGAFRSRFFGYISKNGKGKSLPENLIGITTMNNSCILHFKKPGLQSLVQDKGRNGFQAFGVPVGGAMDKSSAKIANWLVGNPLDAPVLEIALMGPKIEIAGNCQIALTGANLSPCIDQESISMYETLAVKSGSTLSFGKVISGCRTYLAVGGNWKIKEWLGSRSASSQSGKEVTPDSIIQKNSQIQIQCKTPTPRKTWPKEQRPSYPSHMKVRVLPGPEFEEFSRYSIGYFFGRTYKMTRRF